MNMDYLPGGPTIAYVLRGERGTNLMLCVMDRQTETFHQFSLSLANASRLAAECSDAINVAIGGADYKMATEILRGEK